VRHRPAPGQNCLGYGFDLGSLSCNGVCTPSFSACRAIGWRAVASADFNGRTITGTSSGQLFAAGSDGTVLHYDGSSWEPM
jgi:hypothetical protein